MTNEARGAAVRAADDDRRQAAGSDAAGRFEAQLSVGGCGTRFNAERLLKAIQHRFGAFHVTGRPHANDAVVLAFRPERKVVVEGRHAVRPARRDAKLTRDERDHVERQVTEDILNAVEDLNQSVRPAALHFDHAGDAFNARVGFEVRLDVRFAI